MLSILEISKRLFGGGSEPLPADMRLDYDRFGSASSDARVAQLLRDRRYCLVLTDPQIAAHDTRLAAAWLALEQDMALVPGVVIGATTDLSGDHAANGEADPAAGEGHVRSFYLDRCAVTNAEFARFVAGGGYGEMELWPSEVWANVLQFVDTTGLPGPRDWSNGRPPRSRENHPVVGVCWYEANAYAHWMGKRLPTPAEWERAGSWPAGRDGQAGKVRYPWGNVFEPARANTWVGGPGTTVPVEKYENGSTPNGVYQLIGNVWEWVAARYTCRLRREDMRVVFDSPMGEIRGGAFDTYFETQATCQFRTGQPLLYRGENVGFRCCASTEGLQPPPDPSAFLG